MQLRSPQMLPPAKEAQRKNTCLFPTIAFHWELLWLGLRTQREIRDGSISDTEALRFSQDVLRLLAGTGNTCVFENREHLIASKNPVVFAANHLSMLDPLLVLAAVLSHRPIVAVASRHLSRLPVIGDLLSARNTIWVGRGSARADLAKVYEEGVRHLRAGRSVLVFPQSTRRPEFRASEFNSLGVKLAKRAGVPVCPVAVKTDVWAIGKIVRMLGRIHPDRETRLAFGPLLSVTENDLPQRARTIHFIQAQHARWGLPVDTTSPQPWWAIKSAP